MHVNADHALMGILDVLVAAITKLHDGLFVVARAIRTPTLDTRSEGGKFALFFDTSQDGGHINTSRGERHAGFQFTWGLN